MIGLFRGLTSKCAAPRSIHARQPAVPISNPASPHVLPFDSYVRVMAPACDGDDAVELLEVSLG
jgi:hypothetical protein